jgi:hypothetical protein
MVDRFYPDQLPKNNPPKCYGYSGAEVYGEKEKSGGGRFSDAAVIRPGSAIDPKGKRINQRIVDGAFAFRRSPLYPQGGEKENPHVEAENNQN